MRKVPVLLGLSAILAAGIALFFFVGRSGGGTGRAADRTASALRPGDPRAGSGPAELSAGGSVGTDEATDRVREAARVAPKVRPGAERVIPASSEVDGDELYGIVLGIYGVPVAGAKVQVESVGDTADGLLQVLGGSTDKETLTQKDGTFRVPRPDRWEEVRVTITARGFLDFTRSQDLVDRGGDQDLGVFELDAGVVLGGKVLNADGEPVAGASVRRVDNEEEAFQFARRFGGDDDGGVETGADGRFEMPHQETGEYVIVVEHDDHPTGRFPGVTPQAGGEDTSLVLRLPRGATIGGIIKEFPTGREHVRVSAQLIDSKSEAENGFSAMLAESGFSADGLEVDAEKNGAFLIKGAEAGKRYRVRAFVRSGFMGRTPVSEEYTALAGQQGIELTWDSGGSVTARVVDEATAASISDVEVRFRWDSEGEDFDFANQTKQRSFQTGDVEIDELRPKAGQTSLSLLFSAPGYLDTRHEHVAVKADGDVDIGTIRMRRAPTVRIQVVDAEGDGVKRARVRLAPEEEDDDDGVNGPGGWFSLDKRAETGKTDSDGVIELSAPATPTALLEISHPSFAGYLRRGVPMPAQGTQEETVRLSEGGTIEVLVVDAMGTPVQGIGVRHRYPEDALEEDTSTHETNRRGEVRLRNQIAGMHGFRTSEDQERSDEEEPEWQEVAVSDGRKTEVVLEVAARATLEGKITESGSALDRASVSLVQVEESPIDDVSIEVSFVSGGGRTVNGRTQGSDRTDRTGRYSLEDVPAGEYRLKVTHDDRAAPHYVPVTVRGGSNRLDADLPVNAVEGCVLDADGTPIESASLKLIPTRPEDGQDAEFERQVLEDLFGSGRSDVKTRADGTYRLRGVPTDRPFRVEASRAGYVSARSDEVTVSPGQTRGSVDVKLRSGGTLRVNVLGESGPFTFLQARWDGGGEDAPRVQMSMVRRGEAVFEGLEPGPWIIEKARSSEDGNEQRVVVQEVGETLVDFTP